MFKPHKNICASCNQETLIVVKKMLCAKCNYDSKQVIKKLAGKKTGAYKFIKEPTGEKQLFENIAEERDWKCYVTGEYLSCLGATSFMHVLPKALNKYPLFKLYPPNIQLVKDEIHFRWDHTPRSELTEPYWQKLFDLETDLKNEYKCNKSVIK